MMCERKMVRGREAWIVRLYDATLDGGFMEWPDATTPTWHGSMLQFYANDGTAEGRQVQISGTITVEAAMEAKP